MKNPSTQKNKCVRPAVRPEGVEKVAATPSSGGSAFFSCYGPSYSLPVEEATGIKFFRVTIKVFRRSFP